MRTRIYNNKEQIFCDWRRKFVRLTPEEWVRQQLLHHMVDSLGYPSSRIAVEVAFHLPSISGKTRGKSKRADAVVYNAQVQPLLLIECKAETVPITQKTLDQAVVYNRRLCVPFLLLYNGVQSVFVSINGDKIEQYSCIPPYSTLLQS